MSEHQLPDVTRANPGKRTTKATSAKDIGDPFIEGREPRNDDFLDDGQVQRLVMNIHGRVMNVADAYYAALDTVGLEEALAKEEDPSALTLLAIGAISMVGGKALTLAASAVRGGKVGVGFLGPVADPAEAKNGNESAISIVIKGAVDAGKSAIKGAVTEGTEFDRNKAVVTSFLQQLKANAAITFQHLREDPAKSLSHADLVMLYHSLSADLGHNEGMYSAELRNVIARFRSSTASKIGRTDRRVHGESVADIAARGGDSGELVAKAGDTHIRDTKLVLQVYDDGETPADLMYYVRDYDHPWNGGGAHDHTADLSMFADGGWKPSHKVEPEMAEAATAQNRAMWKRDYEVVHMTGRATAPAAYTDPKTRPPVPAREPSRSTRPPQRNILSVVRR